MSDDTPTVVAAAATAEPPAKPEEQKEAVEEVVRAKEPVESKPAAPEHKLQHNWTFYYDRKFNCKKGGADEYESNLNTLGEFNTLEGFWRLYCWLKHPSEIPSNHNVYLCKGNSKPLWESMPNGGCWNLKVQRANTHVDRLWEELLFACIGGIYDEPSIRAVVLSLRSKGDVISVWTDDCNARFRIGEKLKDIANLHPSTQLEFKMFREALKDHSSKSHAQAYIFVPQQPEVGIPEVPAEVAEDAPVVPEKAEEPVVEAPVAAAQ